MKKLTLLCAALLLTCGFAEASTTLQFSVAPTGATNFANASGTATNGMLWGIVIDSSGNGFSSGYTAFNANASGFLSNASGVTDDYYFYTGTSTAAAGAPFFSGNEAGNGSISSAVGVPSTGDGITGVNGGDPFALIWFASSTATNGSAYGTYTNGTFTLPASGVVSYASSFSGLDPIRSANLTIGTVPEPSRVMLLGLGVLGFFVRRRR